MDCICRYTAAMSIRLRIRNGLLSIHLILLRFTIPVERNAEKSGMLKPVQPIGRVEAVLVNGDRDTSLASTRLESVNVFYSGFEGEAHGGLTRQSCSRVKLQYRPGTEIRNTRQITILSEEELEKIAGNMGISRLAPEWVGANLLISGIPQLTLLPPSSRLLFGGGASLVVDMENGPCKFPGEIIDRNFPGSGKRFVKAARHLRGVTGWVEREGVISAGDEVQLHIPVQPPHPRYSDWSA